MSTHLKCILRPKVQMRIPFQFVFINSTSQHNPEKKIHTSSHLTELNFPTCFHRFPMISPGVSHAFPSPPAPAPAPGPPRGPAPSDAAAVVVAAVQDAHLDLLAVPQLQHLSCPVKARNNCRPQQCFFGRNVFSNIVRVSE